MKIVTNIILGLILIMNFFNCSTVQKLQKETSIAFKNAYYQTWVAGVKGGGLGINLFIPLNSDLPKTIQLDSVYFRGQVSKLEVKPNNLKLFIGRFQTKGNQREDVIMSGNAKQEYGNQLPTIKKQKFPFDLEDNECVVSYKENNKAKYYKIVNIVEKQAQYLPKVVQKKQ